MEQPKHIEFKFKADGYDVSLRADKINDLRDGRHLTRVRVKLGGAGWVEAFARLSEFDRDKYNLFIGARIAFARLVRRLKAHDPFEYYHEGINASVRRFGEVYLSLAENEYEIAVTAERYDRLTRERSQLRGVLGRLPTITKVIADPGWLVNPKARATYLVDEIERLFTGPTPSNYQEGRNAAIESLAADPKRLDALFGLTASEIAKRERERAEREVRDAYGAAIISALLGQHE